MERYSQEQTDGEARVIGELATGRDGVNYQPGGECWATAFAPDESRFAWSCGFRKVVIIPWNRYKNCMQSQDNYDPDGYAISAEHVSIDAGFTVTSLAFGTGTPEKELIPKQRGYWTRFDFTKDLILATGHTNGRIRIWDPYTGKLLLELTDHVQPVLALSFAPDGSLRLVSGSKDHTIKVWDMSDDGNMFKTMREHTGPVRSLSWSPDSKMLCSTGDKQKVFLWCMESFRMLRRLSGHYNDVLDCSFSPDGAMLATASADTRVIVWDTSTGEQLRVLNHTKPATSIIYMSGANGAYVRGVTFSPNGCHISTVCQDGYLRFWNLMSEEDEAEVTGTTLEGEAMLNCTFSPVGGAVAVGHGSGNAVFYLAPTMVPSLLHLSRMTIRRSIGDVASSKNILLPHTLRPYLQYKHW
ncbi:unnamed protein product [Meganyctiphanes norvegica]|uniref:SOCS box domain-containing protein n=1 Tax=Meganyctiphanes norvegica TaxID=48144 RepID=A0AAV2Q6L9_MEGNR